MHIGAAALGGWGLDVQIRGNGGSTRRNSSPTPRSRFPDILPDAITRKGRITTIDTSTVNNSATPTANGSGLNHPVFITVDAAHGVYYVVETNNAINVNFGVEQAIYVGAITGTLADGHVRDKIFSTPAADFDFIYGMALDNTTGRLYFTQSALNQYDPANPNAHPLDQVTGVFSFDVSNIAPPALPACSCARNRR